MAQCESTVLEETMLSFYSLGTIFSLQAGLELTMTIHPNIIGKFPACT